MDVNPPAGEVILVIHWKGGVHTELRLPRRRRGQNSAQTSKEIIDTVRVLTRICPDEVIAGVLNRNGLLTGRGNRWTQERVTPRYVVEKPSVLCLEVSIAGLRLLPRTRARNCAATNSRTDS